MREDTVTNRSHISYNLNSFRGLYKGLYRGLLYGSIGAIKWHARSLD